MNGDGRLLTRAKWCACTSCLDSATLFADEPGSSDLSNKDFENIKRTNCELASIGGQAVTQTPIIQDRRAIKSSKRQASSSSNPVSHTTFVNDETFANRLNESLHAMCSHRIRFRDSQK